MIGIGTYGAHPYAGLLGLDTTIAPPEEPPPDTGLGIHLVIAGIDRTGILEQGSLAIESELNARDTASLSLRDRGNTVFLDWGMPIEIRIDSVLVFAGIIDEIEETIPDETSLKFISLECVDYNALADRHNLNVQLPAGAGLFVNVNLIVTDYSGDIGETLFNAGVTIQGTVPLTPVLGTLIFPNVPVSKAFDEIAELTGYEWNIDYLKVLHFFDRASNFAPFALDEKTFRSFTNVKIRRGNEQYRNVQYLRAGYDITSTLRIDRAKGDGETRSFDTVLEIAEKPFISIDGVPVADANIGIREKDKDKLWFYQIGEKGVNQDSSGTPLTTAQTIEISYKGRFPILQQGRDEKQIAARKGVEGGVGVYVNVEDDTNLNSADLAEEKVAALLRRFAKVYDVISYETDEPGVFAGMLQKVDLPEHRIVGDFLITGVNLGYVGETLEEGQQYRYTVNMSSGEFIGGWVDFYKREADKGRALSIRENEQLILLRQFFDGLAMTDTLTLDQPLGSSATDFGYIRAGGPWVGGFRNITLTGGLIAYGPFVGTPPSVGVS